MKTAESIERQEARKQAEKRGGSHRAFHLQNSAPVKAGADRRKEAIKPFQFKPGVSGNPGGRPKVDLAAELARALFEQDGPAIFAAFQKVLRKGSPYAFQVLSDRAYGKLKETHAHEINPYREVSDTDIHKRIREIEQKLGYSQPQILPPVDDESKPN